MGCRISAVVADLSAHPYAQIAFIIVCVAWFAIGFNINILTAALSIMAGALANKSTQGADDTQLIKNRLDTASYYTGQVSGKNAASFYKGSAAAATARTLLGAVQSTTDVASYYSTIDAEITELETNDTSSKCTAANTSTNCHG